MSEDTTPPKGEISAPKKVGEGQKTTCYMTLPLSSSDKSRVRCSRKGRAVKYKVRKRVRIEGMNGGSNGGALPLDSKL